MAALESVLYQPGVSLNPANPAEAGGLLEWEFGGHNLVDLFGAGSAEWGEPGAVVGEDVGDGDGERSRCWRFLTSNW